MSGSRSATAPSGTPLLEPLRDEAHQLDPPARASLERSFGASFGDVVVHNGPASGTLTKDLGAAALTIGRHVVFGEGRYDPTSMRSRMLLAHELGHVVEQRRGGGDPDLGEHAPAGMIPARDGHTASTPRTAALAALGHSAAITGTAGVGIAREPEEDERDFADLLMEGVRDTVKRQMGRVEGIAQEGGQIVDTGLWAVGKADDVIDDATGYLAAELGASKEDIEAAKAMDPSGFKLLRNVAKEAGMVDPDTGAIMVSPQITRAFDWVDNKMDTTIFAGMKPEEGFFTEREVGQLEGAIFTQVALAFVGVEEIQVALKVVSGLGALKAIVDAIDKNPSGFATDRAFWVAVVQAGLHLIGLKSASVGKKILAIAVEIGSGLLAASNEIVNVRNAYLMPPGPERDKALKVSIQGLIRALAAAVQQAIAHARTAGRAAPQEQVPPAGKGTPPKTTGTTAAEATSTATKPTADTTTPEPASTTAKPTVQADQPGEPVAARPGARVDAHTDVPTTTAKAPAKPAGQPKPTTPAMPATQPEVPATKAPTSHPSSAKATKPAKPTKPAKAKTPARKRTQAKTDQANAAPQTQPVAGVEQPPMQMPTSPTTGAKATRATVGARSDTSTAAATTGKQVGKQAVRRAGKQAGKGAAGSADTITAERPVATGAKAKSKAKGKSQAKTPGATTSKAAAGGTGSATTTADTTTSATSAKAATKASGGAAASTRKQVGQAAGKTRKAAKASVAAGTTDTDTATTTTATAGKQAGKKAGKQAGKAAGTKSEPGNTSTQAGQKPEAAAAPPITAKKPSAGKKGGAAQEPEATKKGTTPVPATTGPRDQHGLPPGWDYTSNPKGPKRRWRIGDAVNMPDSDGRHPVWGTVRKRIWMTKAAGELARHNVGTSRADQRLIPLDPIEELTPAQLKDVQETGKMPRALGAEVEHARIPQRVGRMLEDAGVPRNEAAIVTKVGDPSNLEPTNKEWHAVADAMAKKRNPNRNRTLPASLDDRIENPLGRASNEEIAGIVAALRKPGVKLDSPAGQKIRAVLAAEKQRRGHSAGWEVP